MEENFTLCMSKVFGSTSVFCAKWDNLLKAVEGEGKALNQRSPSLTYYLPENIFYILERFLLIHHEVQADLSRTKFIHEKSYSLIFFNLFFKK